MEPKKPKAAATASAAGLLLADKQIAALCDKVLPSIPHLLSVPTKTPFLPVFPHENQSTPFEPWEVSQLQYMTLISNGDRGVGYAQGNWEEAINARSPQSAEVPSAASTPMSAKDPKKPAIKMSIADYKKQKATGARPSPRPAAATPEFRSKQDAMDKHNTHSRNTSNISITTPMARIPSLEGGNQRPNGAGASSGNDKPQNISGKEDRIAPPRSKLPEPPRETEKPRASINGNSTREPLPSKDTNKDPRSRPDTHNAIAKELSRHGLHGLPPKPPPVEHKKRPLESGDAQPEKRQRIEPSESRTPSTSQKPITKKVEESKPSPLKSQRPPPQVTTSQPSPPPKKPTPTPPKPVETKGHSSKSSISEKPHLPPLLSPLPADLETPPQRNNESLKVPEPSKATQIRSPKGAGSGSPNTIVVKAPHMKKPLATSSLATSSPLSIPPASSTPFVLPRLLSPDLPDIVEAELQRLQQKSATLNTVEARHEKARQPGALGVAQRRPKVGHPPKKSHAESTAKKTAPAEEKKKSLIVKLPIKKKDQNRLAALLRLKAKPSKEFKALEAQRLERERSSSAVPPPKDDSDSEEDVPIIMSRATKGPAPTMSRKRPIEASDRSSPAPKRTKLPESIDVAKASTPLAPPFKSPSTNGPSVVKPSLLATPKKGDTMKSVAMRKVDSTEGHARTPQPTSTSTPASAEKPRLHPERPIDQKALKEFRAQEAKFYPIGTNNKRHMQAVLTKPGTTPDIRLEAIMQGIEGLMAYMLAFHYRDKVDESSHRPLTPASWEQFFPIWNFVYGHTRAFPELAALLDQLGAVSREQLVRIYLQDESRNWDRLTTGLKMRDQAWQSVKKSESHLRNGKLGVKEGLGAVSEVAEAVGFGVSVLRGYAAERGMEWKGDESLPGTSSAANNANA